MSNLAEVLTKADAIKSKNLYNANYAIRNNKALQAPRRMGKNQ